MSWTETQPGRKPDRSSGNWSSSHFITCGKRWAERIRWALSDIATPAHLICEMVVMAVPIVWIVDRMSLSRHSSEVRQARAASGGVAPGRAG